MHASAERGCFSSSASVCVSLHRSLVLARVSTAAKDGILFCSGFPQRLRDGWRACPVNLTKQIRQKVSIPNHTLASHPRCRT